MSLPTVLSRLTVLLFSDIVDSTGLKSRLGTANYSALLRRHNEIFESQCRVSDAADIVKHTGDGYVISFATASVAVRFALAVQARLREQHWPAGEPLHARIGIHVGEVLPMTMAQRADVVGLAADSAARVMSIGVGGQILLTRFAFNEARQFVSHHPVLGDDKDDAHADLPLKWIAHGPYRFKGIDEPMEVFEVGAEGLAPLTAPPDGDKAQRIKDTGAAAMRGWRPALAVEVPDRPGWRLARKLNDTDFGEIWLATHPEQPRARVYQFCFERGGREHFGRAQTLLGSIGGGGGGGGGGAASPPSPRFADIPPYIEGELDEDAPPPRQAAASPGGPDTPPTPDASYDPEPPGQIGPYHLGRRIGEGGMGAVYLAEQREPLRRQVALKLIKPGMDSREVISRFQAERQALAIMNHPNIARVLDAGADERGRPYFVMEYVPGEPITSYCDTQNLTTRQRLELFACVCDAVQHAHAKGIIHRDIKPSNVLVTLRDGKPVPVVIDFGVAKATDRSLTEQRVFTELGRIIGTPEYISPEQAEMSALDVDTRTDIYSLGVLLYELLTGALPFDPRTLRSAAYNEIRRIIREVDPPRPSTRLSGLGLENATRIALHRRESLQELTSELRRDLEWIPIKALRKNRDERYDTASEMAKDVRAYLAGRPLLAAPDSVAYKLRKFVRRNRGRVTAAAAVAAAVMITLTVASVIVLRARDKAVRAEANMKTAQQILQDFGSALADRRLLNRLADVASIGDLLQLTVRYVSDYTDLKKDDPVARSNLAQAWNILANVRAAGGNYPEAFRAIAQCLSIRRQLADERPDDPAARRAVAEARNNYAVILQSAGDQPAARAQLEQSAAILKSLSKQAPDDHSLRLQLAQTWANLGGNLRTLRDLTGARNYYDRAIEAFDELLKTSDRSVVDAAELGRANALNDLAFLDRQEQKFADAAERLSKASKSRLAFARMHPDDTQAQRDAAQSVTVTGDVQLQIGAARDAEASARRAIELWQAILDDPRHRELSPSNSVACTSIAYLCLLLGRYEDALEAAKRACDFDPTSRDAQVNLAHAHLLGGRFDQARDIYLANINRQVASGADFRATILSDFESFRRSLSVRLPGAGQAELDAMQKIEDLIKKPLPQVGRDQSLRLSHWSGD